METPEEQRATTLLNIIIDLTQRLNNAESDAEKYKRWWLEACEMNANLRSEADDQSSKNA